MHALTKTNQGDLPALLDTLTVAVTTLDAVGIETYRELYLYVLGTTGDEVVRDLRVEDGQLIVGPPGDGLTHHRFHDRDFEGNRRALLLAEVGNIMRIWKWSSGTTATYLRCSETILSAWINRSTCVDAPMLPRGVIERVKRLSIIDHARYLSAIPDQDMPQWLSAKRPVFAGKSIEEIILGGETTAFAQLILWALNSGAPPAVH